MDEKKKKDVRSYEIRAMHTYIHTYILRTYRATKSNDNDMTVSEPMATLLIHSIVQHNTYAAGTMEPRF